MKWKLDPGKELPIIIIIVFIVCLIAVFAVLTHPPDPEIKQEQSTEVINNADILTQENKRVCEILDIKKDIIECFYGEFSVAKEETYARISYKEIGYEKIYIIVPGGRINIYKLEDKE